MSMNAVDPARVLPRLGPESRLIRRRSLGDVFDKRSREGRFLARIEAELTAQIGEPSFTQRLLIRHLSARLVDAVPPARAQGRAARGHRRDRAEDLAHQ
jgi:hypothetical protein